MSILDALGLYEPPPTGEVIPAAPNIDMLRRLVQQYTLSVPPVGIWPTFGPPGTVMQIWGADLVFPELADVVADQPVAGATAVPLEYEGSMGSLAGVPAGVTFTWPDITPGVYTIVSPRGEAEFTLTAA
jgi:hypothetical protein